MHFMRHASTAAAWGRSMNVALRIDIKNISSKEYLCNVNTETASICIIDILVHIDSSTGILSLAKGIFFH